ncbi:MAG: PLP-dependent aminotransferase family protein [Betaproteobacteria bacterium]|nr:PLP-dependent aminotransferase family protein [Betaproteobacteria bacterium]
MPAATLSRRLRDLHPSPIREILSVIERPGMISFAGGLPAPESFPELEPGNVPTRYLQYGSTEGEPELRERLAADLNTLGITCSAQQVLILSGSQQGIDLVGKLFVDEGTRVGVESPTYLAALQALRFYGARFVPIMSDPRPAFAYVIPTFQNPTGHCYTSDERDALAADCDRTMTPLFEDDPYRDLVYQVCDRQPVCARVRRAAWIYQGSFSKSLAPGMRLGFLAASPDLFPYLVRLKQAADLHTNRISQWLALQQLEHPARAARLSALAARYSEKRDAFAAVLSRELEDLASWRIPPGGLFFWLRLRRPVDTRELLAQAITRGIAFMPGEPFHPEPHRGIGTLRLNFSHANAAQAVSGLATLGALLRETSP